MLTPDYAELQLDIDSFRLQNNQVTRENDEISASRFKYSDIISNVKMQQGNSGHLLTLLLKSKGYYYFLIIIFFILNVKYIFIFYGREDGMSKNMPLFTHIFFLFCLFFTTSEHENEIKKKYSPFNVFIRKNTFSIKMVFLLSNSIDVINVFFSHLVMSFLYSPLYISLYSVQGVVNE